MEILDAVSFVPIPTQRLQVKQEGHCPGGIDPGAKFWALLFTVGPFRDEPRCWMPHGQGASMLAWNRALQVMCHTC